MSNNEKLKNRIETKEQLTPTETEKAIATINDILASRKSCEVTGTGLSHYILVDDKTKK